MELSKNYSNLLKLKTDIEMKNELIKILEEDNPDQQYWKELDELMELMYKNDIFEKALKLMHKEKLTLPVRSKFIHFEASYEELCYNIGCQEQLAEMYQDEDAIYENYIK